MDPEASHSNPGIRGEASVRRHRSAAAAHARAAATHERASAFWANRGHPAEAALERRGAELEASLAELERDWAALKASRTQ